MKNLPVIQSEISQTPSNYQDNCESECNGEIKGSNGQLLDDIYAKCNDSDGESIEEPLNDQGAKPKIVIPSATPPQAIAANDSSEEPAKGIRGRKKVVQSRINTNLSPKKPPIANSRLVKASSASKIIAKPTVVTKQNSSSQISRNVPSTTSNPLRQTESKTNLKQPEKSGGKTTKPVLERQGVFLIFNSVFIDL